MIKRSVNIVAVPMNRGADSGNNYHTTCEMEVA